MKERDVRLIVERMHADGLSGNPSAYQGTKRGMWGICVTSPAGVFQVGVAVGRIQQEGGLQDIGDVLTIPLGMNVVVY